MPVTGKQPTTVLLNDAERYSYTANEIIAVNRYFGGIHNGEHRGWAIVNGDEYTSDSALTEKALSLPTNLKLVKGKPMMITESTWVMPNEHAAEGPFLIAVYSSLTGFDAYYWFATGVEGYVRPRSANGYLPSQAKWLCMTPDMAGQFQGAALAFRSGYIKKGEPVLEEHRSLKAIYERKSPMIAETASFDPNRDAGDQPANSNFKAGVTPYAFLAGPVEVVYDSDESKTKVHKGLKDLIKDVSGGKEVTSVTGEVVMNTADAFCTVNTEKCQGVSAHFKNRKAFELDDVRITCENDFGTVMFVSYDGKPLKSSEKVLLQIGMQCRPSGWKTKPVKIKSGNAHVDGKKITNFGKAPWQIVAPKVQVAINNKKLSKALILDATGAIRSTIDLKSAKGGKELKVPSDAMHIMLVK